MASYTLDNSDNIWNAPLGDTLVDAQGGTDTLVLNWSTVDGQIRTTEYYGWGDGIRQVITDDGLNTIDARNFNIFKLTGGSGDDDLRGWNNADTLKGGAGDDTLSGGLGADVIDGGTGLHDTWSVDYSSLGATDVIVTLSTDTAGSTVAATSALIKNIEQLSITTGSGDDKITTLNTDTIWGNDTISTGAGDDIVKSGRGVDHVHTGDGVDTVVMNWAAVTTNISMSTGDAWYIWQFTDGQGDQLIIDNYTITEQFNLTGGSGNDYLRGRSDAAHNDVLKGEAGNDTLAGYQGIDTIDGGAGTDLFIGDFSDVTEGVKVDINAVNQVKGLADASGSLGSIANIERLNVTGTVGNDIFTGKAGVYNDVFVTGGGNDTITTGRGVDSVSAGTETDTLVMNWSTATTNINMATGSAWYIWNYTDGQGDKLTITDYTNLEQYNLTGGSGNDYLQGRTDTAFDDILVGGAGNDTLNSGGGNDQVNGGSGTDQWIADVSAKADTVLIDALGSQTSAQGAAADLVIRNIEVMQVTTGGGADNLSTDGFSGNDSMVTNGGNDTVNPGRGIDSVSTGAGTDTLIMNWGAATTDITHSVGSAWYIWQFADGEGDQLTIADYTNLEKFRLTGGSGDDYLRGRDEAFNDILAGGAGDDTLNSGAGNDKVDGGTGTDTWIANQSAKTTSVLFNATTSQTTAQGEASGLAIRNIEVLNLSTGSGKDKIDTSDYAGNDTVYTNAGIDAVSLGKGFDVADGGADKDTLTLSMTATTTDITRSESGGWYTYIDVNETQSMQYRNFEIFKLYGGSGNDTLYGGSDGDTLSGGSGNDYLAGYGSTGGTAATAYDTISGGSGSDTYYGNFDGSNKTFNLVLNASGTGNLVNALSTSTKFAALSAIENVTLYTGLGNDTINLGAVAQGNQTLYTRDGNDTVTVAKGHHYLDGGTGTDTAVVDFSSSTTGISGLAQYGNQTLADKAGLNTVTFANMEVFNITGGSGNDRLFAYGSDDTLRGGLGNDVLYGGAGNDILYGGDGSDVFRYSYNGQGLDTIMDAAGGDLIKFDSSPDSAWTAIAAGNGTATGYRAIEVETKGDGYTYLYFGTNGTAGADITMKLFGTYGTGAFQIVNDGHDLKVISGSTSTPTAGDDVFTGTSGNDTLDGGAGNDKLYGKDGDDTLIGGDGNDLLVGGMGHDTLTGDAGVDTFDYNLISESMPGALYSDSITDFTPGTDKIDLSTIDANPVAAGNDAFTFIGTAAFGGNAGELRWEDSTVSEVADILQMDVNGDGVADMEIVLAGSTTGITAASFVL